MSIADEPAFSKFEYNSSDITPAITYAKKISNIVFKD
jgi:hypothetical protein